MGINLADLAAYLNEAVAARVLPSSTDILAGTIANRAVSQRISYLEESAVTARRIGFATDLVPVAIAFTVDDAEFIPAIKAKKHTIQFAGTVAAGDTIRIGETLYTFAVTAASVTDGYGITLGTGVATVVQANFRAVYALHPDTGIMASLSTSKVSLINNLTAFPVGVNVTGATYGATCVVRDGAGDISLVIDRGAPVSVGDTMEITFASVTRADGRVLAAKTSEFELV